MDQFLIKNRVLGVDISMERTTYAIVDVRGNIIAQDYFNTLDYPNVNEYISVLVDKVIELTELNGGYDTIRSMGVSCPSANFLTGSIENAANMPWKGVVPMAAMLRDRLGMAVAVGNDAHVSALGEHVFGLAHGMNNFVVISLGHGIGSCIFSQGRPHLGAEGFAGEFGHTCVIPEGRQCGCGNKGCLETYCAERGIVTTAHELMQDSNEPSLMRQQERLTPRIIFECCEQGDAMAQEVFRRTGRTLGFSLASLASVIDPEAFIFTGGIAKAGHWLLDSARDVFEEHVFHNIQGRVKFLRSTFNDRERDVLGASVLAWGIKEYSLFK